MSVINTNVKSIVAQNAATVNNRSMSKVMEQLSTGKRINGAADDAAGLAISNKMTSQIRGLNQAVRNANDGISMIQVAEGATTEVTNMLQRMRELGVQAINDTNTTKDRTAIKTEYQQLAKEIQRISNNTEWNTTKVANASANSAAFQVGANSSQTITVTFSDITALSGMTAVIDAATAASAGSVADFAGTTISNLDTAISAIDSYRSTLGASINRLNYAADNLQNVSANTSASRSRILDTDYAQATTELARTQIIQQAATAMLAQANQQPQSVLSLLR
ncbi:flagellin [Limnohabitans sp. Bal53]|uniref:flagellin N-terminal helical domain-containing protein n=1 Tax=Limnohabitans sp. Bal53 TaxID=1977910 RepID=UPI000D36CF88|nr:flagellin [Limnohabitans sp. Bal53]PUE41723.1 flagellin [Limnohabitans sp. Bal53]